MISTVDISGALRVLGNLGKQARFATAVAANRTASSMVRNAIPKEMRDSFDRPTVYAQRAFMVQPLATRENPVASVRSKDASGKGARPASFLRPHIDAGRRSLKRSERALEARGLLPAGEFTVPGAKAKLDSHGNMSRGQVVQILSALRAFAENGYLANRTARSSARAMKRGGDIFVGRPAGGRGRLGVYRRVQKGKRSTLEPLLVFVRAPRYEMGRFDLQTTADMHVARHFDAEFARALAQAVRTGR